MSLSVDQQFNEIRNGSTQENGVGLEGMKAEKHLMFICMFCAEYSYK